MQRSPFGGLKLTQGAKWLILLIVGAYFVELLLPKLLFPFGVRTGFDSIARWFGLTPSLAVGRARIWQLVTYQLVQHPMGIIGLIFDALILLFCAVEIERMYGWKRLWFLYWAGGVFGGLVYCLFQYGGGTALGATPGVFAVLVLYTVHFPRRKIFFFFVIEMELWLATAIFVLIYVALTLAPGGGGGVATILGGAAFGFVFYRLNPWFSSYMNRVEVRMEEKDREEDERVNERVDELLDKINREGMTALTRREKSFLNRASKRFRER
ncbi:MAG: rhomboid family intramembrane serine protease [Planctomycetota bacterium]